MTTDFRALCAELVELCSSPAEGVTGLIERWEQVWDLATRARAALAQPEPERPTPADGEVAELVTLLRAEAADDNENDHTLWMNGADLRRAADLLERLSPPQPVPVSERLPGAGDCTANPRTGQGQWCWGWVQHDPLPYSGRWRMIRREWLVDEAKAWLPAHALPVPTSENV